MVAREVAGPGLGGGTRKEVVGSEAVSRKQERGGRGHVGRRRAARPLALLPRVVVQAARKAAGCRWRTDVSNKVAGDIGGAAVANKAAEFQKDLRLPRTR